MGPHLLALDTSTDCLAVGLLAGEQQWLASEPGGTRASSRLIALALELVERGQQSLHGLDAVAFGAGPGAFTGLRTACAVAQGLAFGLSKPAVSVDSLMIVAEDARRQVQSSIDSIWVAMDARMGEAYAACYRWDSGQWLVAIAPALWPVDELARHWHADAPKAVAGSAIAAFGTRLPWGSALLVDREQDRPGALLALAQRRWFAGAAVSPANALPIYLRDRVAFTTAERDAQRLARLGST
jgi:tRNA threonylcarbamoyladenosine biosynthesis protein TsaB